MTVADYPRTHTRISDLALAMPQATETVSHGSPAWRIGEKGKMFAYLWHDHHGDGITAVIVKTSGPEHQAMLIEADPDLHYSPPYLGPSWWIGVRLDLGEPDWDQVEHRIRESWKLVAPTKLLAAFGD
ncbi:MmcQ/YjbR family DNA-binding protein [Sphingomonas montanisoli]|uniref:MmcQ/YjbR family DNA-binding protein n=1 Tax=Sphingomonas montanisoli TaxID=2606412 RepID=A0A5D9BZY3_9SPHN|nr:MmcQ/YjbR family DNA-binding protein [Sphingomonas montanisoli]TZG25044.1 MmcQ/YjbR family DNA-binding protein [Sphingomonas montanisoli]